MGRDRQPNLPLMIDAFCPSRGFASGIDGGKEEGDQEPNDPDHDKKLDEGEAGCRRTTFEPV